MTKSQVGRVLLANAILVLLLGAGQATPAADLSDDAGIFGDESVRVGKVDSEKLLPDTTYLRELKGNSKERFVISATAGSLLRFSILQKGIDIVCTIKSETGETVKKVDRPNGAFGREFVTFLPQSSGLFSVEITAWSADATIGRYQIAYSAFAEISGTDRQRDRAEDLTSAAEELRSQGTRESKEKALRVFSDALAVWDELGDKYEQAVVLYGLGFTNYGLSNNYEAARMYYRALKLHSDEKDIFGQAVNHAALGSVQYILNEKELSAYNYRRASEIYKSIGNNRGLGIVYHGLGTVAMLSENFDEALVSLNESLKWRFLANDIGGTALTRTTLAKAYLSKRDFPNAKSNLEEIERVLGAARAGLDFDLNYQKGRFSLLTGNERAAEIHFEKALEISKRNGNKLGEAQSLADLSIANLRLGRDELALSRISDALSIIEQLRESTPGFRNRVRFSATIQPYYEQYITVLMEKHRLQPERRYDQRALEISEQARARGLLDQLERRSLIDQNPVSSDLLEREQILRDQLTNYLASRADGGPITGLFQAASVQFTEIEAEIDRQFNKPQSSASLTLKADEIRGYLDENTVMLQYFLTAEGSFLWYVSNESVKSFKLAPKAEIEILAEEHYACISRLATLNESARCGIRSKELSKFLLAPVAQLIQGKRIIVVKHGMLHFIPFNSLSNPADGRLLIESNEIGSVSSASLLKFLTNTTRSKKPAKTVAIFADPIYAPSDPRLSKNGDESSIWVDGFDLPRLYASRFEAERIASFAGPENFLMMTDANASREAFLQSKLENYRILHFAVHTLIDDRQPELSSIALSNFNSKGGRVFGLIRSSDILRLDLNSDLVVLSACRSNIGQRVEGEGIISFSQTFYSAGARSTISSLWNVGDKVTAELMSRFYRNHLSQGMNASTALRAAQLEIMRDGRWKSPYYWAAFSFEGAF
ncbi:MAG: CHAT domain-containing protein [Acidobacteria bacterium]|nr:CHAT domain-containing protein [Acidobacteriota bacterium]